MIPGVTDFNTWEGRALLQHAALNTNGKRHRMIGRGTFARVYESATAGRVLKVTTDRMSYWSHCDGLALEGNHYPVVFRDFDQIGELRGRPVYMVELELLTANRGPHCQLPYEIIMEVEDWASMYGEDCVPDLHSRNIMRRPGTGTAVVSDAVCDQQQLNEFRRRAW